MDIVVRKYGGSSLATLEKIDHLAGVVAAERREPGPGGAHGGLVLVISAMGSTTDQLLQMAHSLTPRPPERELDMLLTTGEQAAVALMAIALSKHGVDAISFTGQQVGLRTSEHHTRARIVGVSAEKIHKPLREGRVVLVAGFQGVSPDESYTTLGRGGSDITAVALAGALRARRVEKCTDQEGVSTADPKLHPEARIIDRLSYEEMLEMSHSGAKVLHPRAVFFAWKFGVPLVVRSSVGSTPGTLVCEREESVEDAIIRAVTHDVSVAKVTVYDVPDQPGLASRIFEALADKEIDVDMIVQSTTESVTNDISFTVKRPDVAATVAALEPLCAEWKTARVKADPTVARVSLVGLGIKTETGVASSMFRALADNGINIQMIATSDVRLTCVIAESQVKQAVKAICKRFGL